MKLKPRSAEASAAYREGYIAGLQYALHHHTSIVKHLDELMLLWAEQSKEAADETDNQPDIRAEQSP